MISRLVPLTSAVVLSLAVLSGCSLLPFAFGARTVDTDDVESAAEDWLQDDEDVTYKVRCADDSMLLAEGESIDCEATDRDTDDEYDIEITIAKVDGRDFEVEVEVDRDTSPNNSSNDASGGGDDVFSLVVGDCFNDAAGTDMAGDDPIGTVDIVDCDELHEREVYDRMEFEGDDNDYPGEQSVIDDSDDYCLAQYEDFVGIAYDDSVLYFLTFYPTEDSWGDGDREVLCLISEYDENDNVVPVEGSLEGAQR